MQLVVVRAVRNAVSAATMTFTANSIIRFFVIVNFQFSTFRLSKCHDARINGRA